MFYSSKTPEAPQRNISERVRRRWRRRRLWCVVTFCFRFGWTLVLRSIYSFFVFVAEIAERGIGFFCLGKCNAAPFRKNSRSLALVGFTGSPAVAISGRLFHPLALQELVAIENRAALNVPLGK